MGNNSKPPPIIPRALPKLEVVQKPSIRKVDEIDDLVTKQVHDNAPKKHTKKLQKTGAIPKSKATITNDRDGSGNGSPNRREFEKANNWQPKPSEIVDDVLYIAGPLKKEVHKRDSLEVNQLLAFPLIPSDKFDPVNTLSKRKSRKKATSPSGDDVISNNNP